MHSIIQNIAISLFLSTFIVAGLVSYQGKKTKHKNEESNKEFWAKEQAANVARKKDISDLDYIEVPFDKLPEVDTENYDILSCMRELKALEGRKIVNLSAFSNADLKLAYGIANFQTLSSYDDNYSQLIRVLANLGCHLSEQGFHEEAKFYLELGLSYGSDLSRVYLTLADEYLLDGSKDKVEALIEKATTLDSVMASSIKRKLLDKLEN